MPKLRVAIAGATGYAGEELIRILLKHPNVELTAVAASAKWEQPLPLGQVLPGLTGRTDLSVTAFDTSTIAKAADLVFLALPHGVSQSIAPDLLKAGCQVIDLAGDFRLKDKTLFQQWYGVPHADPNYLSEAVYGLTEWAGDSIKQARFIANPGCYATAILLALIPLAKAGLIDAQKVVVDAKSGLTGAGRKASTPLLFGEMNENLWAYKVNAHQHTPEIEQAVALHGGEKLSMLFVPHVVPLTRGIHADLYAPLKKKADWDAVYKAYQAAYADAPFVRLKPQNVWPQIRHVAHTNFCDIGFTVDEEKGMVMAASVIDNLVKGAAGQAVQNMNVMAGHPETSGLY